MKIDEIKNKGQAQIFRNRYIEYFTKTHPLVIWAMYMPVFILLPYYSANTLGFPGLKIFFLFLGGIIFWTFFEYIMHRFVFHRVAESPRARRISYIMHGNHHEFPRDKQRLFMPPVPSLILSSIVFLLIYAFMQKNAMSFFPGFLFGYLMYGSMHYAIHAWNPRYKWMKPIWRNHQMHHYKDEHRGFGVSSHLWDLVFGTQFNFKKDKEDKEEVRKLMFNNAGETTRRMKSI